MGDEVVEGIAVAHANPEVDPSEWEWDQIEEAFYKAFRFRPEFRSNGSVPKAPDDLVELAQERVRKAYDERERAFTEPVMRQIERVVMLQTLDSLWKDHLLAMDHLKEGIGLRGYAQKNPLYEYQKEGFSMFEAMMRVMQEDVVEKAFSVQLRREEDVAQMQQPRRPQPVMMSHGAENQAAVAIPVKRDAEKVGRNDPCPCGSGKKYKRCHGK
jgi:preprotein translocase subunit SecA